MYRWQKALTDELVMSGDCTLSGDVLILHSYDSIAEGSVPEADGEWSTTDYYMTVSETGVTEIRKCSDGSMADDNMKKEIGTRIGCTMRFRQG
ncbi:MAG: hypothetical protein AB7E96_04315 [Deferribacterales bacterium]